MAFGDSLTAGYQLAPEESYPSQLEALLKKRGLNASVTNAGVSGDTSTQALARVDWNLKRGPYDFVLLEIGANDGLRLMPVEAMERNVRALVAKFQAAGSRVILLGIKLPTNLNPKYRADFEAVFKRVARQGKLTFMPFLLEGVAMDEMLNLEDQMHPNAKGYAIVAHNVAGILRPQLAARRH